MAQEYDIEVKQGATYLLLMTLKDPSAVAINLTGYVFSGQIRKTTSDPDVQADFSFNILTQSGPTLGQVEAILTATETTGIDLPEQDKPHRKLTVMVYDIESNNSGEVVRWLEGKATISPEVTR